MKKQQKWLTQIDRSDSVGKAARVTLRVRLESVAHYLKLSAKRADESDEYVHQLRVSTRRALAALMFYRTIIPRRRFRKMRKRLSRIRSVAGEARDLDVFLQRCRTRKIQGKGSGKLLRQIEKRRARAQRPIRKLYRKQVKSGKFARRNRRLIKSVAARSSVGRQPFESWGKTRFAEVVERFLGQMPSDTASIEQLHRFRISAKRLRYTIELLSPVLPNDDRDHAYQIVVALQDRLGEVIDHSVARQWIRRWMTEQTDPETLAYLERLLCCELADFDEALAEFHRWWTPTRAQMVAVELRQLAVDGKIGSKPPKKADAILESVTEGTSSNRPAR